MKKISILTLCAALGLSAMAQESVVKDAERSMKKGDTFETVLKAITPAINDATTSQWAQTYYIPGMAAFKQYDGMIGREALGQLPEDQQPVKAGLLLSGYEYMMKALPLDSVPEVDKKGNTKIKTKYSKDIINTISGHYGDYNNAAVILYNSGDYKGAYQAWNIFTSLPSNPAFAKSLNNVPADTIMAEIFYNQALAAWQVDEFVEAMNAFISAKEMGYSDPKIYDYAIAVASSAGRDDVVYNLAMEGNEKYGATDSKFIGILINKCINEQDYTKAVSMIDDAIKNNPDNAQYYVIRGILFEQDGVDGDPKAEYAKAYKLDPTNALAAYNYGRMIMNEGITAYNNAPNEGPEFARIYNDEVKPKLAEAATLIEAAYNLDNDNIDALRQLEQIYYLLNDNDNLQRINSMLGQ